MADQQKGISFFIDRIKTNQPFVFAKYGDGEYFAATQLAGGNCDGTPYSPKLGQGVKESFQYITQHPNVYIGQWNCNGVDTYFQNLVQHPVQWVNYNIFIFKSKQQFYEQQLAFYRAIRESTKHKVYVCNPSMTFRAHPLLNINETVPIDPVNWFDMDYEDVLNRTINAVRDSHGIILTSAGMGAKVLISDLHKRFPEATIIDIGSALDFMCSGRRSRDFHTLSESDITDMARDIMG